MLGVLVQEQRLGLGIELEGVEAVHTVLRGPGRVVRAEENLPSSVAAEILDQFSRVAASLVGGGVDVRRRPRALSCRKILAARAPMQIPRARRRREGGGTPACGWFAAAGGAHGATRATHVPGPSLAGARPIELETAVVL